MALPDLRFFTDVPYSKDWKDEFKDYFQSVNDPNDALYHLNRYAHNLDKIKDQANKTSKGIQIANRLHELKKKVFLKQSMIREEEALDKVGIVIIRKDNKALFTVVDDNGTEKYGFPKGQYEYKLRNPADIYSVYGEGFARGALRELKEETGFDFKGKINTAGDIYTGVLERSIDGKKSILPILGGGYKLYGSGFYLVLFVDSKHDLESEKAPPNDENIIKVLWQNQYTEDSTRSYNSFSKHRFEFPDEEYFNVQNNANVNNSPVFIKRHSKKHSSRKKSKGSTPRSSKRSKSVKRQRESSKKKAFSL